LTVDVPDGATSVRMHNVCPRLSGTPGEIRWPGGDLGQDNERVYGEIGLSSEEQRALHTKGVI
jgi:crotonobetainyl-CoA:carnitine CoA-transferase CaiB-like acyl-CoA transferase